MAMVRALLLRARIINATGTQTASRNDLSVRKMIWLMSWRSNLIRVFGGGAPRLGEIMSPPDNSFGVLRLVMASAVLVSHSYLYSAGHSHHEPLFKYTCHSLGEHAVQVFFILSGLLVAQSFDRSRNIADFALARTLRIFPALIVCVLLTAFVIGPIVTSLPLSQYFSSAGLPVYVAKTIALVSASIPLPGVFEDLPLSGLVNTSLWTLKYEVLCYIGLGLAGLAGLFSYRWRHVSPILVAFFMLFAFLEDPISDTNVYTTLQNVRYFAVFFSAGVLAYLIRDKLVLSIWGVVPLLVAFYYARGTILFEVTTAVFFAYTALWASKFSFGPLRDFCNRFDLSFGVYIYAGPVQQMLLDFQPSMTPVAIAVSTFIVAVPLAFLSWVMIEHPALKMRKGLLERLMRLVGAPSRAL